MKRVVFLRNREFAVITVTNKSDSEVIQEFSHTLCLGKKDICYIRNIPMKETDIKFLSSLLAVGGTVMASFLGRLIDNFLPFGVNFWANHTMSVYDKDQNPIRRPNGDDKHITPERPEDIAEVIAGLFGKIRRMTSENENCSYFRFV